MIFIGKIKANLAELGNILISCKIRFLRFGSSSSLASCFPSLQRSPAAFPLYKDHTNIVVLNTQRLDLQMAKDGQMADYEN